VLYQTKGTYPSLLYSLASPLHPLRQKVVPNSNLMHNSLLPASDFDAV